MNAQSPVNGWYWREVPQDSWNLSYKPLGHADPIAKTWIEVAARIQGGKKLNKLQNEILSPTSPGDSKPGRCMKCHTIESAADTPSVVHWSFPDESSSPLTVFNHDRHIALTSCETCHTMGSVSKKVASDFQPVRKETCLTCHNAQKVRQDCLLCHRYHTEPRLVATAAVSVSK
jgi:hypothetical protein